MRSRSLPWPFRTTTATINSRRASARVRSLLVCCSLIPSAAALRAVSGSSSFLFLAKPPPLPRSFLPRRTRSSCCFSATTALSIGTISMPVSTRKNRSGSGSDAIVSSGNRRRRAVSSLSAAAASADDAEEGDSSSPLPATAGNKRIKVEVEKRVKTPGDAKVKAAAVAVTPDESEVSQQESSPAKKKSTTRRKKQKPSLEPGSRSPPANWEETYRLVEELRRDRTAPCDHSGCEALPDRTVPPKQFRFQVLASLMLSSQTKDATVGDAIRSMQRANVLSVDAVSAMPAEELNGYINKVGFHNNKTKYLKQVVEILKEQYGGDIPSTAAEMIEHLPGVGPKMAYICENASWGRQSGIGVDTHMHRLFNSLKWVNNTRTPEQTRREIETWLPRDRWADVNLLWVGFGQEVQQFKPKALRKALDCSRPAEALRLLKKCGLDSEKEGKKLGLEAEVRSVLQQQKSNNKNGGP